MTLSILKGIYMWEFANAFNTSNLEHPIEGEKIVEALCLLISSTQEAIDHYNALADACENPLACEILRNVADKERLHISELGRIISIVDANQERALEGFAQRAGALVEYTPLINDIVIFSEANLAIA
jgi:rubrerythrin